MHKNIFCFTGNSGDPELDWELCDPLETCETYHIITDKGFCVKCEPGFFPDENARECREVEVNPFEFVNKNGQAEECTGYEYPDKKDHFCKYLRGCEPFGIVTEDGNCQQCGKYEFPDEAKRVCVAAKTSEDIVCSSLKHFLDKDGLCKECPAYTHPDETGYGCVPVTCAPYEIMNYQGTSCDNGACCELCGRWEYPDRATG